MAEFHLRKELLAPLALGKLWLSIRNFQKQCRDHWHSSFVGIVLLYFRLIRSRMDGSAQLPNSFQKQLMTKRVRSVSYLSNNVITMPSALLLWMLAIEQFIHRPINWDRVWRFEIIASTGDCAVEADKQKTSAAGEDLVQKFLLCQVDPCWK